MRVKHHLALWAGFLAVVGMFAATPIALADVSDVVFVVHAATGRSEGSFTVHESDGYWDPAGAFHWSSQTPINIEDAGHNVIATLGPASIDVFSDPQINLSFAVQAGETDTVFEISSALLSFPSLTNPQARASASFTVTDVDGDGGLLDGLEPQGGSYLAQYNGFVPAGTTFAEMIPQIVAPEGGSNMGFDNYPLSGWATLPGAVSNMSAQIGFTLSANDFASGTSNYELVPEPAGLLILLAGLGILRRR